MNFRKEVKRLVFGEKPFNSSTLSLAEGALNNWIRFNGLSSQEVIYVHDQFTRKQLIVKGKALSAQRELLWEKGHYPDALSKSIHQTHVMLGIQFILNLRETKHNMRNFYLVEDIVKEFITDHKFVRNQLR